jgi:hypothetical protein
MLIFGQKDDNRGRVFDLGQSEVCDYKYLERKAYDVRL